ncbi:MAG: hypothetical protein KJ600_00080 [Nanoarchaeota archaeon]|nr:hypothetical protein [Nanoarchaeota archaeon]MBU1102943.1 hypothetical protein [Nanoarchaeota archaeon]
MKHKIQEELKLKNYTEESSTALIGDRTNDKFYDKLIKEINSTYFHEDYTACFILSRKLFENMVIDILRSNFKKEKELYQDLGNKKKYNDFSVLLNNLKTKRADLGFSTTEIDTIIEKLSPYRIEANSKTHSIIDFGRKEAVDKYNIEETFDLLKRVWNA